MVEIYHENDGIPGYRMLHDYLAMENIVYSYPTIFKYMHELGLYSIVRRKKPGYVKGKANQVFANLVNQGFHVNKPNTVWCTDFTYMPRPNGNMRYNCTIMDLYDRSVVATLNGSNITSALAIETLKKALRQHKPGKGIILHSDQGSQYTSKEFNDYCTKHFIQQSMSRAGCPYDNAPMERFYNTFKNEFYNIYSFRSDDELDERTYEFIYGKYNHKRPHSYNGGRTPHAARYAAQWETINKCYNSA